MSNAYKVIIGDKVRPYNNLNYYTRYIKLQECNDEKAAYIDPVFSIDFVANEGKLQHTIDKYKNNYHIFDVYSMQVIRKIKLIEKQISEQLPDNDPAKNLKIFKKNRGVLQIGVTDPDHLITKYDWNFYSKVDKIYVRVDCISYSVKGVNVKMILEKLHEDEERVNKERVDKENERIVYECEFSE